MTYDFERDLAPTYLLGPFDSRRMVRLEGMPGRFQRLFKATYVDAQLHLPSVWRNVTYVTPALHYPRAQSAQWNPDLLLINAERFGDGEALRSTTDSIRKGERPHLARSRQPLDDWVRFLVWHEHAHGLFEELLLADRVLGSTMVEEIEEAVREFEPTYEMHRHDGDPLYDLTGLVRVVPSLYSLTDHHELVAELVAHYELGYRSPLVEAVGTLMRDHCDSSNPLREERQRALLDSGSLDPVVHWRRAWEGGYRLLDDESERDLRYLSACDHSEAEFIGGSQIARAVADAAAGRTRLSEAEQRVSASMARVLNTSLER